MKKQGRVASRHCTRVSSSLDVQSRTRGTPHFFPTTEAWRCLLQLGRAALPTFMNGPLMATQTTGYCWSPESRRTLRSWLPDGRSVLYTNQAKETGFNLWVLPLFGDRKPEVVVRTSYNENRTQLSPNRRMDCLPVQRNRTE